MEVRRGVTEIDLTDESTSGSWSDMRRIARSCSRMSLVEAVEARTQRTYRYGIGLVCIGATLNWLGFAQGHGYVDPLRYLGVACVICGSFCVCLAMFRWFGKPLISYTDRLNGLSDDGSRSRYNGDVHVINVSIPISSTSSTPRSTKPPDYDSVLSAAQLPSYYEAIKLCPVSHTDEKPSMENLSLIQSQSQTIDSPCELDPSSSVSVSVSNATEPQTNDICDEIKNFKSEPLPPPYDSVTMVLPSDDVGQDCIVKILAELHGAVTTIIESHIEPPK